MGHFKKKKKDNIDQPLIDTNKESMIQNLKQSLKKCKHPVVGGVPTILHQNLKLLISRQYIFGQSHSAASTSRT